MAAQIALVDLYRLKQIDCAICLIFNEVQKKNGNIYKEFKKNCVIVAWYF